MTSSAPLGVNLEWFTPGCPCCIEEVGLGNGPLPEPTAGKHRHPILDPNESLRNESTQCQYCYKNKETGVTFFRCSACMIDFYCSKECQKKAWPSHKEDCKRKSRVPKDENNPTRRLQRFTGRHRPVLADSAVRALNLSVDINRSLDFVLAIFLRRRDSQKPETSYFATGADVLPLEAFPPEQCTEMKAMVRKVDEDHKKGGMDGGLLVLLMCLDDGVINIAPAGFSREHFYPPGTPWKELLMAHLNEGVAN
ncbi:hypothetical protein NLI96_g5168 [Meripilus lineatus]|uniref:MYND-type domain-containing protein n=1 Tax=Meripilus lineatus TaxID=2056292 RepID=A0AAD5V5D7_9APHY|nr:hypothetical protein NLI96_g5168 [Physisporinus lineatus]